MKKSDLTANAVGSPDDVWLIFSNDTWFAAFNTTRETCLIARCDALLPWNVPHRGGTPVPYAEYLAEHRAMSDLYKVIHHGTLNEL